MRGASLGQTVFAALLVVFGVVGLIERALVLVWPVPEATAVRDLLVYGSAVLALGCGAGLLVRRSAGPAGLALGIALLAFIAAYRLPAIAAGPVHVLPWDGAAEPVAVLAAAWLVFARTWDRPALGFAAGDRGVRIARVLYGLAMVPFGLAHLTYVDETASLVPSWLPEHVAWAYVTGAAFLAAGAAIVSGVNARLAATLSVVQIGAFTVLVWGPVIVKGEANAFAWSEAGISALLTAAGWVIADSYRGGRR